jgi:hypothetical protein
MTYFEKAVSSNIFDDLPDLAPAPSSARDELDCYLAADVEDIKDGLAWWSERSETFLCLSHMAHDYLSIPGKCLPCFLVLMLILLQATTVDVEWVFSQGRLILPYVCSRLSVQTTRALMCIGAWSNLGLVKDKDIKAAIGGEVIREEPELPVGWDAIKL